MDEVTLSQNDESGIRDRYLTFAVGDEDYGLEITHVSEIIKMQAITEVPEIPAYIKGIINLRGKILPVMDVRLRFNRETREYDDRTCIIVVDINANSIGLIIDAVREVMDISAEEITSPSGSGTAATSNRYIRSIGKTASGVKLLLDVDHLVSDRSE